jgi:acetyltransferase-like isoleucine patch superfamily enzyme
MLRLTVHFFRFWRAQLRQAFCYARIQTRFPQASFDSRIVWQFDTLDALEIGDGTHIGAFSEIVAIERTSFSPVRGRVILGPRCVVGAFANLRGAGGEIRVGANCLLGQNVTIVAANHENFAGTIYRDAAWDAGKTGVVLGENCWIGAGAIILPGVTIGANAVIAAGSVVTRNVPTNEIWGRVPAEKLAEIKVRIP